MKHKKLFIAAAILGLACFTGCNSQSDSGEKELTVEELASRGMLEKTTTAAALIQLPPEFVTTGNNDFADQTKMGQSGSRNTEALGLNDTEQKIRFSCPGTDDPPASSGALIAARLLEIKDGQENTIEEMPYFEFNCPQVLLQVSGLSPDYRYKVRFLTSSSDRSKLFHGISEDFAIIPQQLTALRVLLKEGSGEREPDNSAGNVNVQVVIDPATDDSADLLKVVGVYVKSSYWNESFASLAPFKKVDDVVLGWKLPGGASQLADASTISWSGIDTFAIEFNQPIKPPQASAFMLVKGTKDGRDNRIAEAEPKLVYGNRIAIWNAGPLLLAQYMLILDASQIRSAASNSNLDGEWQTGVSEFTMGSGNGIPGGDFKFIFNSLIGDVNGNGTVSWADIVTIRNTMNDIFGYPTTAVSYRLDVNGSGRVGWSSATQVMNNLYSLFGKDKSDLPPAEDSLGRCTTIIGQIAGSYPAYRTICAMRVEEMYRTQCQKYPGKLFQGIYSENGQKFFLKNEYCPPTQPPTE